MFFILIEFVTVVVLLTVIFTQILLPLFKGRPLFPFFRKQKTELEKAIAEAKERLEEQRLKEYLDDLNRQLQPETKADESVNSVEDEDVEKSKVD